MRISSNLFFQTGLNSINAQQADLVHLYKQVGSGQRMVTPSDDPLAAAQAINVSQTLAMSERYAANRKVAMQNLGMQENVLNSVTLQLQEVKTRLVEAGNGTWSDIDRAAMAEVLETAREGLLNLANSTDGNGQYLFSGALGRKEPFDASGNYVANNFQRIVQVDQTREMTVGDIGTDIFSRAAPGTVGYVTVPGAANTGTAAVASYEMTNSTGLAAGRVVDIEFVADAGDPTILNYRVTVQAEGGATLTYEHAYTEGATLLDAALGLTVELSGTPKAGDTFHLVPMHSPHYTVETDGDAGDAMVRSVSGYSADPVTLRFESVPGANPLVDPVIPGFWIDGVHYPVDANFATDLVFDLSNVPGYTGVIEFDTVPKENQSFDLGKGPDSQSREELNLFAALDDVIAALRNGTGDPVADTNLTNALNSALQRVDVVYNNVLSVRASAGTRMNELTTLDESGSTRILDYKYQLSQLEDLDYYTAITQLQLRTTALEAAAMAFQKIQNTSLFNLNARG